eukprot:3362944-Amphidinium_carterae.1
MWVAITIQDVIFSKCTGGPVFSNRYHAMILSAPLQVAALREQQRVSTVEKCGVTSVWSLTCAATDNTAPPPSSAGLGGLGRLYLRGPSITLDKQQLAAFSARRSRSGPTCSRPNRKDGFTEHW